MATKNTEKDQPVELSAEARSKLVEEAALQIELAGESAFQSMASLAASEMLAHKAYAKEIGPEVDESIKSAWEKMCTPSGVLTMGLLQIGDDPEHLFRPQVELDHQDEKKHTLGLGLDADQKRALALGVKSVAALIDEVSGNEAYGKAARAHASLAGKLNRDGSFGMPLLGLALKGSTTKSEGKMVKTVSAGFQAGVESGPFTSREVFNPLQKQVIGLATEGLEKSIGPQDLWHRRSIGDKLFRVGGELDSGRIAAKAEDVLPTMESMRIALDRWTAEGEWVAEKNSSIPALNTYETWSARHQTLVSDAAKKLASKAQLALSMALDPESGRFDFGARAWRLGLESGPLAQSRDRELEHGLDVAASNLISQRVWNAIIEMREVEDPSDGPSSHSLGQHLARIAEDPVKFERMMSLATKGSALDVAKKPQKVGNHSWTYMSDSSAYENLYDGDKRKAQPLLGRGLDELAGELAKGNPALGICQWAVSASKAMRETSYYIQAFDIEKLSGVDRELGQALQSFDGALLRAQSKFAKGAIEEALKAQEKWLAGNKVSEAWSQAGLTGNHTPRSVAWALQNPSKAMLSSDPMERMAAGSARALGLKAGADGELSGLLRQELEQLGVGDAGWGLLETSDSSRQYLLAFLSKFNAKAKQDALDAKRKWPMACRAIEAAGRAGLDEQSVSSFCEGLVSSEGGWRRYGKSALEDGLEDLTIYGPKQAQLMVDLGQAKRKHLQSMVDALAFDWKSCVDEGVKQGVEAHARALAQKRAGLLSEIAHGASEIDWRKNPFENKMAWEVFGMASHRMGSLLESAKSLGALEAWAAEIAPGLGIGDADDVNALVGKVKVACKEKFGMSDGAWKMAIKSSGALKALASSVDVVVGESLEIVESASLAAPDRLVLRGNAEQVQPERWFYAAGLAAAQGADPVAFGEVMEVLKERGESWALFSRNIERQSVSDEDGALFYKAESESKASRMPKIFQEMCKRWQKLNEDFVKAKAAGNPGVLSAKEALSGEVADLSDWLVGSELGIWQNLPKDATWGQLKRISKLWHDEQEAIELDRLSREKAKFQEEKEAHKLDPFASRATEHWEPIMGSFKSEGWEAVELTSQAQLTVEGQAMKHCVSSYSGYCREGSLRIFSIRFDGERKCTMEVRGDADLRSLGAGAQFKITQNKGKHNAEVTSPATRGFCKDALAEVEKSWKAKHAQIMELRRLDEERKKAEKEAAAAKKKAEKEAEDLAAGIVVEGSLLDSAVVAGSKPKPKAKPAKGGKL